MVFLLLLLFVFVFSLLWDSPNADLETEIQEQFLYLKGMRITSVGVEKKYRKRKAANKGCVVKPASTAGNGSLILQGIFRKRYKTHPLDYTSSEVCELGFYIAIPNIG